MRPFRIHGITFNPRTGELHVRGRRRRLRPQSAAVLAMLMNRAGGMVSRHELLRAVWPRVSDAADKGLNACVRDIRRALGDDPESPTFIETIPRRGYRFLEARSPSGSFRPRSIWRAAAAAGLIGLGAWGLWMSRTTSANPREQHGLSPTAEDLFRAARALSDEPGYAPLYRARALLDTVLVEFPRSGRAHAEAAYADFMLGDQAAARRHVDTALELEPLSAQAHATKAAIALYWDGDEDAAKRHIATARVLSPDNRHVLLTSGFIAAALGDAHAARSHAGRLGKGHAPPAIRVRLGYLHYVLGQFDEMEHQCTAALAVSRRASEAERCRLLARLARGDAPGAVRIATAILGRPSSRDTDVVLTRFWTRELESARRARRGPQGVAHFQAAQALAMLGDVESAVTELLMAEKHRPVVLAHVGQFTTLASLRTNLRFAELQDRVRLSGTEE